MSSACVVALALAGVVTAGSSSASGHPRTGTITGVFEEVGGPATLPQFQRHRDSPHPLSGVVVLTSSTGRHISFQTDQHGAVRGHVAPGVYAAIGRTSGTSFTEMACPSATPVVVRAGHHTHFTAECHVP
jgi:hypothetical protein